MSDRVVDLEADLARAVELEPREVLMAAVRDFDRASVDSARARLYDEIADAVRHGLPASDAAGITGVPLDQIVALTR